MILKYKNAEGLEWLVKSPADTLEQARSQIEVNGLIDDNGSGPWTFAEVEHEHSFPHEREPQPMVEAAPLGVYIRPADGIAPEDEVAK